MARKKKSKWTYSFDVDLEDEKLSSLSTTCSIRYNYMTDG